MSEGCRAFGHPRRLGEIVAHQDMGHSLNAGVSDSNTFLTIASLRALVHAFASPLVSAGCIVIDVRLLHQLG
jgi:hypothetical protein